MQQIALITCSEWPKLSEDDKLLLESFENHGIEVEVIPWDSKKTNWQEFDICILRSTWNYHYNFEKFLNWLDEMKKNKINLWNSVKVVRWNSSKFYLKDLEKKGVKVVPTIYLNKKSQINLKQIMSENNFSEVVIKPAVGASAYQIQSVQIEQADKKQKDLEKMVSKSDILIQPLVKEIQTEGEWSLIFFGGKYSHGILKKPKRGDYRIQSRYGGVAEKGKPDEDLIKQAEKIVNHAGEVLYARVDGINIGGQLTLMELELIEPALFFSLDPGSANKFVETVLRMG